MLPVSDVSNKGEYESEQAFEQALMLTFSGDLTCDNCGLDDFALYALKAQAEAENAQMKADVAYEQLVDAQAKAKVAYEQLLDAQAKAEVAEAKVVQAEAEA